MTPRAWAKLARDSVDAGLMALECGDGPTAARRLLEAERAVRELLLEIPADIRDEQTIDMLGL